MALETIENLYPSLPVLSKLTSLLKEINIDQSDITNLIKTDASLTSDIIRISNTPYYGSASRCSDINSALLIIGQDKVLKVVSLCISRNLFNQGLAHYGIPADDYWCNSIASGLLMESMSFPLGIDRDKAYTAGILHSVGMTIINRIMEDLRIEMFWDTSVPQTEWEEQITGYNYAIAGAEVLGRWKFPSDFTDLIRYQAQPGLSPKPSLLLDCLHFVINVLNRAGWKLQLYESMNLCETCSQFLEEHRIDEEQMKGILNQTHHQMTKILSAFSDR